MGPDKISGHIYLACLLWGDMGYFGSPPLVCIVYEKHWRSLQDLSSAHYMHYFVISYCICYAGHEGTKKA